MRGKFWNLLSALGVAVLLASAVKPAAASTITFDVVFAASNFTPLIGSGTAPIPLVLGGFSITLDPAVISSGTTGVSLNFLNMAFSESLAYFFAADTLFVGGDPVTSVGPNRNDFTLRINGFTSGSPIGSFVYSQIGETAIYQSGASAVHVSQVGSVATTPLPAALPLFLAALGGLGVVGWRRRKPQAA